MNDPDNRYPDSTVTLSMLIAESVYRLIVRIGRLLRWFTVAVIRPLALMF